MATRNDAAEVLLRWAGTESRPGRTRRILRTIHLATRRLRRRVDTRTD